MSAPRVIVLEDEALVALMMEDLLSELGCDVVASFGSVAAARDWLNAEPSSPAHPALDGALLDVNLGGELVFPFADLLRVRQTPFAFATGYGSLRLEPRFIGAPVLTKPVNPARLREVVRGFGRAG